MLFLLDSLISLAANEKRQYAVKRNRVEFGTDSKKNNIILLLSFFFLTKKIFVSLGHILKPV